MKAKTFLASTQGFLTTLAAVVALNVIGGVAFHRFDATEDKLYTLSEGSRRIASQLEGPVTVKLFASKSARDVPAPVKAYATRVEEVLRGFAARSDGKLSVEVVDPKPDTDEEEWARRYGIQGVRLPSGEELYLGAVFIAGDREQAVPYLDPRKEETLEYDIAEALVKTRKKAAAKLGILSQMPVLSGGPMGQGAPWVLGQALAQTFTVESVPMDVPHVPDDIQVLLVVHPKNLTEKTLYAIDQFLMRGGRVIVAVDPFSRHDLSTLNPVALNNGQLPQTASDMPAQFKAWGIAYDAGKLVGDPLLAARINAGGETMAYPMFMLLGKEQLNRTHKTTSHLRQMVFAEGGSVGLAPGAKDVAMTPLIETSASGALADAQMIAFFPPAEVARNLGKESAKRTLAALFTGKFPSSFAKAPEGVDAKDHPHLAESGANAMIAVLADVDFLTDANTVDKIPAGPQVIVRPRNDNLNFLINVADFMGGSEDLISIRSSGTVARPFTRVAALQKEAGQKWQAEEEALNKQLADLQTKLNQLQAQRTDGDRASLTPEQEDEIKRFRDEEAKIKKRRREVRKSLREDIERLGTRLAAMNLIIVPLGVSGLGFTVFVRRSRRTRKEKTNHE